MGLRLPIGVDMSDIEGKNATVRREDQLEINEFGKLNGRKKELKEELEAVEVCSMWLTSMPHTMKASQGGACYILFPHSHSSSPSSSTRFFAFFFLPQLFF